MKKSDIIWSSKTFDINELKPYEFNPRTISDEKIELLKESILSSGYNALISIDTDMTVIAGHQRIHVMKLIGYTSIECRIPNKKLTKKQFQKVMIQDNVAFGDWDYAILNNHFEIEEVKEWGVDVPDMNMSDDIKDFSDEISDSDYKIIVDLTTENEQQKLYSKLTHDGYKCKIL